MKKLLLLIVILFLMAYGWYHVELRPVDTASQERSMVTIEEGMGVSQIADLLAEKGVIRSPLAFKLFVRFEGVQTELQAGKFIVRPAMSVPEIVELLRSGKAEEQMITIPEGFTVKDIDMLLAKKGLAGTGETVRCAQECDFSSFTFLPDSVSKAPRGGKLEGYLFPETYYVTMTDFVSKFFLERMLTTFRKRIVEGLASDIAASKRSLDQIVTMASLIEEETRTDAERPVIAGILWKRFDAGLGLGVDATVRYILDKPTDDITVNDLNTNSPYNTRKFKGLPPGPIASPSLASIQAALRPAETKYWYYLHGKDWQVHYAVTNEEQNVNRYLYLR
ncbi:MAG: endolytic transglycosylase MltG [Candidatus Peregrinibacteria bacterium]